MNDIFGLAGHKALVVGGGYGSGRLTAHLLAEAGANVAVADIDADRAKTVADEIGGFAVVGDVTSPEGARQIVDTASDLRFVWWRRRGSNPRPSACKADSLPTELRPRARESIARVLGTREVGRNGGEASSPDASCSPYPRRIETAP